MEPIDIWRSAKLMVDQHGRMAPTECALKADAMATRKDADGQAAWLAIERAAAELLEHGPPTDVRLS